MKKLISLQLFILLSICSFSQDKNTEPYLRIPVIDLDKETFRQVVVDREEGQYLGHPTTVIMDDGKTLAVLLRENARRANSQIIFSKDEGKTWNNPRPLPNELTGDRHVLKYTPDGRLLVVFRDISPLSYRKDLDRIAKERNEANFSKLALETGQGSPTEGDWVGWVGKWKDLVKGKPGQYRIRFKDNIHSWDCCYPGVELLPDGTFVVTTYGHWEKDKEPYIVSIRINMNELDKKLKEIKKR